MLLAWAQFMTLNTTQYRYPRLVAIVIEPEKNFNITHELRNVVASHLSLVVILAWAKFFGPKPPTNLPQANRPAQTAPAAANPGSGTRSATAPSTTSASPSRGSASGISDVAQAATPPKAETQERTIVVE